ncbi:MAG: outer membrane beta-barrel protein [Chitinophagaceae bacterium]|nr:outer membrane beta-barrel protein [Chitinophagaceae bacterium]
MKKIIFTVCVIVTALAAAAQTVTPKKDWKKEIIDRPSDHIMVQLTSDHWSGVPDSISSHMKGLSRGLGISFMFDKPFKTDPHWSVAFGIGVNGSSMFFNKMAVDIKATGTSKLPFRNLDSSDHFKKYKLVTVYLEVPVELRYIFNPEKENKSWKAALGLKVGTLINAHTKGKTLVDKNGTTLNSYTEKESKKSFFGSNRVMATARVGIGHFTLVCNYQLSSFLKDGVGPDIKPFQVGICISGL